MILYHKINSPYKRNMEVKGHPIIKGDWAVEEFELLKDVEWVAYEKIDGTNIRVIYDGEKVTFGGRTERSDLPKHLVVKLTELFPVDKFKDIFPELGEELILYGEGFGHKIQKGGKYLGGDVDFILFDIQIGDWLLKNQDIDDIANKLDIKRVPKIKQDTLMNLFKMVENGFKSTFGDFYAEGIVVTPALELFDRAGRRIITKIKHKDFFINSDT